MNLAHHGVDVAAEGLRAMVRRTVTAFLLTQMNHGAFRSKEAAKKC